MKSWLNAVTLSAGVEITKMAAKHIAIILNQLTVPVDLLPIKAPYKSEKSYGAKHPSKANLGLLPALVYCCFVCDFFVFYHG